MFLSAAVLLIFGLSGRAAAGVARATWGTEEGLPSGSVNDIEVGRDGYVWIATYDGLARFDGTRFTVFDADTTPGLPTNRIVFVREAPDGAIWMATETGAVVRRDAGSGEVRSWSLLPGDRPPPLLMAHDGSVWTAARGGAARFDGQDFVHVPFEGAADIPAVSLTEGLDGAIWAGFGNHFVARRDASGVRWFRTEDGRHYGTRDVVVGPDGGVWVVSYDGLLRVRGDGLVPVDPTWEDGFESVWPVGPDEAWVGAESGLYHWKDGRRALVVASDPAYGMRHMRVVADKAGHNWALGATGVLKDGVLVSPAAGEIWNDLVADPSGGVWVGSGSHGLMRLRDAPMETLGPAASPGLQRVYGLAEGADGAVWAGTLDDGLYRISEGGITRFTDPVLPHRGVLSTLQDPDGTVWAGLLDVGLARVSEDHLERVSGLPDGTVRLIERLRDGTLLTSIGDTLWRRGEGGWAPMVTDPLLPSVPVRAALESDGVLWLATGGAGLLRVEGGRLTRFSRAEGFPSDTLRTLWRSAQGTLWIGTEDRGLLALLPGATAPRGLSTRDGLPDHTVHAIVADGLGGVWGSTNKGLFRVDEADLEAYALGAEAVHVVPFGVADGMAGEEANGGVARTGIRTGDGRLWFASQAGVVVVRPDQVRAEDARASPHVEALRLDTGEVPLGAAREIAPSERSFGVDFTALPATAGTKQRFWYRLDDVDPDWVDAGGRRTAWYTQVPPGEHVFHVRTRPPGEPAEEARVTFSVVPRFVETVVFRALLVVAALGAAGVLVWSRLAAAKRRERLLEGRVRERTADLAAEKEVAQAAERTIAAQAARLAEVDRLKTRFFQDLSHELRTPLTLVIGPLEDVRTGVHGAIPPAAAAQVGLAERNARRLFALVNQLLDLVRLDAGALRLERSPRDLVALVAAVAEVHRPLADRRGITLVCDLPADPVLVDFDGRELEKVFANLLANALKFTPSGGRVTVSMRVVPPSPRLRGEGGGGGPTPAGEEVEVAIADSGPGLPSEVRARLFERFHTAGESSVQAGSGIGLSLARDLTERHDGRIVVESVEGQGSTFTVVLPRSRASGPVTEGALVPTTPVPDLEEGPEAAGEEDDRTTVLVADDHPELRAWIRGHLAARYRVIEAANGREALALARRALPDLVISDVMMPELDGLGLLRGLRADPELDTTPVVMLTARGSDESRVEGLRRGADAWLTKPFSPTVLVAQVDGLLAQRRLLAERLGPGAPADVDEADLSADDRYLNKVKAAIEAKLHDPAFGVEELADAVAQNRAHLFRRVKELTGEPPSTLLRTARLERAATLLARRTASVGEIAYAVGFNGLSSFSRAFREHYGVTPTAWGTELR